MHLSRVCRYLCCGHYIRKQLSDERLLEDDLGVQIHRLHQVVKVGLEP